METNNIFDWMTKYHEERNLAACSPYIEEGRIISPANRFKPIHEGRENKEYQGILILKNGSTLIDRLVKDKHIRKRDDISTPMDLSTIDKFFDFMDNREDQDGVYVYESNLGQMMRISKIYDDTSVSKALLDYVKNVLRPNKAESASMVQKVPNDFVFYNGIEKTDEPEKILREWLGTKTRLAMDLTDEYKDIHAYQIKASGYTPLGMGKVTHFTHNGLAEEYFFKPARNNLISGIHRKYEPSPVGPVKVEQIEETVMAPLMKAA